MSDIWNELTDSFNKNMAIDEMSKKYLSTYLLLIKENKEEIIVQYKGYHEGYHVFYDTLGVSIKLRHETNIKIVCVFPERKLFNHGGGAYEFVRLPHRQYRRGICKDNAKIVSPVRGLWQTDSVVWDMKMIESAIHSQYPASCEEALNILKQKKACGVALSEKFMLTQSFTTKSSYFYLFYSSICIGYFEKDIFYIKHPLFKQEVLDNLATFKPYKIEF